VALEAVAAQIRRSGGKAVALAGDVREEAYAEALVALALERARGARLDPLHLELRGSHGDVPGHGRLCREQGGSDRTDPDARGGARGAKYPRQCPARGRHGHSHGSRGRQQFTTGTALLVDGGISIYRG